MEQFKKVSKKEYTKFTNNLKNPVIDNSISSHGYWKNGFLMAYKKYGYDGFSYFII